MDNITVNELKNLLSQVSDINIIDVREPFEFEEGHIDSAKNIPLSELEDRMHEFNGHTKYYMICRSGKRSSNACEFLDAHNIHATNVNGGMLEWNQ